MVVPILKTSFKRLKNSSENSRIIAKNTFYAAVFKGLSLIVSFFSAPAFISYFNNDIVLGLWFTMLSILSWFLTFDLGIGNGLRNHLVKAIASNNKIKIREVISSGITSSGIVTLLLGIIGTTIILSIDLNKLFNISSFIISREILLDSTLFVFGAVMLRFFLTCVSSIFYALQKAAINNLLALIVGTFQLLYILIAKFDKVDSALLNISFAYLLISNIPIIIAAVIIFVRELRGCHPSIKFVRLSVSKKIIGLGLVFFLCQIGFMIISNTNEFFISHFWGTQYTTDYSFYYRIMMLMAVLFSLILTPVWSMITKAYEERNYIWLKKIFKLLNIAAIVVCLLEFAILPFLQTIMNLWLGKGEINVTLYTSVAFSSLGASYIISSLLSTIVCGISKMKTQLFCFVIGSIVKIIAIIILAKYSAEWEWVIWINVIILSIYSVLEYIHINNIFSKIDTSI